MTDLEFNIDVELNEIWSNADDLKDSFHVALNKIEQAWGEGNRLKLDNREKIMLSLLESIHKELDKVQWEINNIIRYADKAIEAKK